MQTASQTSESYQQGAFRSVTFSLNYSICVQNQDKHFVFKHHTIKVYIKGMELTFMNFYAQNWMKMNNQAL